jgi:hypothetical protein
VAYSDLVAADGAVNHWRLGDPAGSSNDVLALPFDGPNGDTATEELSSGKAVTFVNGAQLLSTQAKHGITSLHLDGVNDYVYLANSSDWDIGSTFTIECWVYLDAYPAASTWATIVSWHGGVNTGWRLLIGDDGRVHLAGDITNGFTTSGGAVSTGQWHHLAVSANGTDTKCFIDGALSTTGSVPAYTNSNLTLKIGSTDGSNWLLNGYLADLRIAKGEAIYTTAFTPPGQSIFAAVDAIGTTDLHYYRNPTREVSGLIAGDADTAATFNGTNQYSNRVISSFRNTDGSGSIEAWVNNASGVIFATSDNDADSRYLMVRVTTDIIEIGSSDGANPYNKITFSAAGVHSGKHHIVAISTGSAYRVIYDGVEIASPTVVNGANNGLWFLGVPARENVTIGLLNRLTPYDYLSGTVDEVAVYPNQLTVAQAAAHHAAAHDVYQPEVNIQQVVYDTHRPEVLIEQRILDVYQPEVGIHQVVYDTHRPEVLIEQRVILPAETFRPEVNIQQIITARTFRPTVGIKQVIHDTHRPEVLIEQRIAHATYRPEVGIRQVVYETVRPEVNIHQQVISDPSYRWRIGVVIGGVDYSARVTGIVSPAFEEGANAMASVTLKPSAGVFDPLAWSDQAITVDYIEVDASNTELWRARIYTGKVDTPGHEPETGLVKLSCSTRMQKRLQGLPREQIDALTAGRWSAHVFDEDASNWQYTQDRLSTRAASIWVDRNNAMRVTDWAAKASADYTFTNSGFVQGSARVQHGERGRLINDITVTLDFRFSRHKQRNVAYGFMFPGTVCDYLRDQFNLPQRSQVESAATGSGWTLQGGISYEAVWEPGVVPCGRSETGEMDNRIWDKTFLGADISDLDAACIGARFTLGMRWVQTVTETYTLQVVAPQSIETNGTLNAVEDYGIDAQDDEDDTTHEQSTAYRFKYPDGGGKPSVAGMLAVMPTGAVELENGDLLYEATEYETNGRTAMSAAQQCILDKLKTEILSLHRENRVEFEIPFNPFLDLTHTSRLNISTLQATGKVYAISHQLDITTGRATTRVTLAISRRGGVGVVEEPALEPIEAPASDPLTEYAKTVWLPFRIGGMVTSDPYQEDWDGYTTNYWYDDENPDPFAAEDAVIDRTYPEQFTLTTPEITDVDRQAISVGTARRFDIDIPNDELIEEAA